MLGHPELGSRVGKTSETKLFYFLFFYFMSPCHSLVAFVCQGHEFLISSLSHWLPVQFFKAGKEVLLRSLVKGVLLVL